MPNYNLTVRKRYWLQQQGHYLCQRRLDQAISKFPLTIDELQSTLVKAEALTMLRGVAALGIYLPTYQNVVTVVPAMPGSPRAVGVAVELGPTGRVYLTRQLSHYDIQSRVARGQGPPEFALNVDALSPESREALAKWAVNAVREARLCRLGEKTLTWFFSEFLGYAATTGHVLARWPALAVLAQNDPELVQRFRDAPRSLNRWRWGFTHGSDKEVADYRAHAKAMQLTDMILATATLLQAETKPVYPAARVIDWARIEGDKD